MRSFIKFAVAVYLCLAAVFIGANIMYQNHESTGSGKPYRVEAERIALKIKSGEEYDLSDYKYITKVEKLDGGFSDGNSDYFIKDINGELYRFDYSFRPDSTEPLLYMNLSFLTVLLVFTAIVVFVYFRIMRPLNKMKNYPKELAKGHLTIPLKQQKNGFFMEFLWGLDLLREKLEKQKADELEIKKRSKTMVLSLSHDIKTPLSVIELYSKALEKGLYKDEEKKKSIAVSISGKCEEIKQYVNSIVKTESEDFLELEVSNGEFYLKSLIDSLRAFYKDKLELIKSDFTIQPYTDCLLYGDIDRAVEILQNIIENAVKYGDGKSIEISFSREENCTLISVSNSGCTLSENELPHIFDSFWRGSNVGQNSGSGLGLYICRTLIRKMKGDIFARTENGDMIVTAVFVHAPVELFGFT